MVKDVMSNARKIPAYILYNLIGIGIYLALMLLLNLVTGGDFFTLAGLNSWQGWDASDVSTGMRVFILIGLCLVFLLTFLSFFAVYYLFLCKREQYREAYLKKLGTAKYDFAAERRRYFREDALPEILFFSGLLLVLFLLGMALKSNPLVILFGALTILENYLPPLIVWVLDAAGLCAFHWLVVPRLHTRWASQRLRVDEK